MKCAKLTKSTRRGPTRDDEGFECYPPYTIPMKGVAWSEDVGSVRHFEQML
jgi:hypothetical protein